MCPNMNCHNDKINYWCMWTECCRVTQAAWRENYTGPPNPEGVCDFLGNRKLPMIMYGMRVCDFLGNHKWGFAIFRVCDLLLHRSCQTNRTEVTVLVAGSIATAIYLIFLLSFTQQYFNRFSFGHLGSNLRIHPGSYMIKL